MDTSYMFAGYICLGVLLLGCGVVTMRSILFADDIKNRYEKASNPIGYLVVEQNNLEDAPSIFLEFTKTPDRLHDGEHISLVVKTVNRK